MYYITVHVCAISYVLCVVYVLYCSIRVYVQHVLDAVSYVLCVVCVVLSHGFNLRSSSSSFEVLFL